MTAPLIVVSGPSGSGKSTVIAEVLRRSRRPLRLAVSATTRKPRLREKEGVDYHFVSREEFQKLRDAGEFLESAEVHGNWYGTLRQEVEKYRPNGVGVILDIDVQGARAVRQQYPDCTTIFLCTSSWEAYEQRLRQRGTEDEASIQRRLATARVELGQKEEFDFVVLNDDLGDAISWVGGIIAWGIRKGGSSAR
jgi:guanylate kinase